jgi:hypothetical protein
VKTAEGKRRALVVTGRSAGGVFYTRPPYQLSGAWRVEVTAGIFDPSKVAVTGTSAFSLEVDRITDSKIPSEFYAVGAAHFAAPEGVNVQARSHGGLHGTVFLPGAKVTDLVIESDGALITFSVRDHAVGGAYQTVGSTPLTTPGLVAVNLPAFGVFGMTKGGQVAFTNFRVPVNGTPSAQTPEMAALRDVYSAGFQALDAVYALDGPAVTEGDVTAAKDALVAAGATLASAKAKVDALVAAKPTPKQRALSALDKASKALDKARAGLDAKGTRAAKPFLAATQKSLFKSAFVCTEALLPQNLRDTLPGRGLDW